MERQLDCVNVNGSPRSFVLSGSGCAGCMGCCTVPGGVLCIILGVLSLVAWHGGKVSLREPVRGERIDMPFDLSREGVYKGKLHIEGWMPQHSLNLCFCKKQGPDLSPSASVLRRLRFSVRIKDSEGALVASSSFCGDRSSDPMRGIELIDLSRVPYVFTYQTVLIEVDVLDPVAELKEVPAAFYLAMPPSYRGGIPRTLNSLIFLVPGFLLMALGIVQLVVSVEIDARRHCDESNPRECDRSSPEADHPKEEGDE